MKKLLFQFRHPPPSMRPNVGECSGFSLVEMAVILLIVSVLLGSSIVTYSGMRDKQQKQKTEILLEEIRNALIGYATTNGYLPCPDVGVDNVTGLNLPEFDGKEDRDPSSNSCWQVYGVLPWQDLGLGTQKFDFYGNYLSYHVDPNYTVRPIPCTHPAPVLLNVTTNHHGVTSNLDKIVVVVVSFGKNGLGHLLATPAGSPAYVNRIPVAGDEVENADYIFSGGAADNNQYLQGAGDDMMTFISPMSLRSKPEILCQ